MSTTFTLPDAPAGLTGPVKAWSQPVTIPTYEPLAPERNPMFLDRRVYQGSSGKVYPLPFHDRIDQTRRDRAWRAVHIENEFIRVMVLPEIGGRIHVGLDKTNQYDFFYRQNVIKPALVGLAGPWISGGVEFNWPQHHRPATYMPVQTEIEEHADGSRTIWCADHDPLSRMSASHGVCIHPGKSFIELKVRLYNRTPLPQTFLWWANVATRVHERYQSFFPTDVKYVADHAKRAMSRFPLCEGRYYGVDYGQRVKDGVPADERPTSYVPTGEYPPNDLSWFANIPVPTSYMAMGSRDDFFGGYDHAARAGLVHVANHHIAPGKKQWTWGNHDFGNAWHDNLTDTDGPYIELMAGVYTDNQPDFSYLAPGETRTFSQYWYPIREIGPAQKANVDAAVSLAVKDGKVRIGVSVTAAFPGAVIRLCRKGLQVARWQRDLSPAAPFVEIAELAPDVPDTELSLTVTDASGRELLAYRPVANKAVDVPPAATEPPAPEEITSSDELYVTGLHLAQYRHATRDPEIYWQEALRRDPGDARCNNAMGLRALRRGEWESAERYFHAAVQRLTLRNPNPYDGEPHYNWGLALRYLGRDDEAYAALYKSTWNAAWRSPAYLALAAMDLAREKWSVAAEHLRLCLKHNSDHMQARCLLIMALRKLGQTRDAEKLLDENLTLNPLDVWSRWLKGDFAGDNQLRLDLALDLADAGLLDDARVVLNEADLRANDGSVPMIFYTRGWLYERGGRLEEAKKSREQGARANPDYCFPARLEDIAILQSALKRQPHDARAAYYLGNLLYDRGRRREAMSYWQRAADTDPAFSVVWRNLGIAYYNVTDEADAALDAFDRALKANPRDARVFYERDQLWKRMGVDPAKRLAELERFGDLVQQRDDLSVEFATLLGLVGRFTQALELLKSRTFQPWEGGEGLVLAQYVRSCLALAGEALSRGDGAGARAYCESALTPPRNLGEVRHPLANQSDVYLLLGRAHDACGDRDKAVAAWSKAASARGDFQEMSVRNFSELTCYSALALEKLGRKKESEALLRDLMDYARQLERQTATVDYFATSLPAMLLFKEDMQKRQQIAALVMQGQAMTVLGEGSQGEAVMRRVLKMDPANVPATDWLRGANR